MSNLEIFNLDSLINITDVAQSSRNKYLLLQSLSYRSLNFPLGSHHINAYILEQAFIYSPKEFTSKKIKDMLGLMQSIEHYSSYDNPIEDNLCAKTKILTLAISESKNTQFKLTIFNTIDSEYFFKNINLSNLTKIFNSYLDTCEHIKIKCDPLFYKKLEDKIKELIDNGKKFIDFINPLSFKRKVTVITMLEEEYPLIIQNCDDVIYSLSSANESINKLLLKKSISIIEHIISTPTYFGIILNALSLENCQLLLRELKKTLPNIIETSNYFNKLLKKTYLIKSSVLIKCISSDLI